ncbi:MAG TPA: DNA repair protein RadC [Candidatus Krumholzibacteria bacterium]|nr:DNA repair protein RadC [Candidatus Krumholzibacteria bacterium]
MRMHELPPDERPRERCHRLGAGSLSAVELVALVLGGGSGRGSTLALARGVLQRFGTLQRLARCGPAVLESLDGIGAARSAALAAAFELGRRSVRPEVSDVRTIEGPEEALALLGPLLEGLEQEAVVVLCLGARHQALRATTVALGQINSAGVHPREVFRDAIAVGAVALILAHNHPSGDPEPSDDDVRLTRRLQRCGETLGIEVLDHLVVGAGRWVSLRERHLL